MNRNLNEERHCVSCGRSNVEGPECANPFDYLDQQWCSYCAAISKTDTGHRFVNIPSPGQMTVGPYDNPLRAWQDCYEMKPKKRILIRNAKTEIQRAWSNWSGDKGSDQAMFLFFSWLGQHRPYFLTFRCSNDRWQRVHNWLIQFERAQN